MWQHKCLGPRLATIWQRIDKRGVAQRTKESLCMIMMFSIVRCGLCAWTGGALDCARHGGNSACQVRHASSRLSRVSPVLTACITLAPAAENGQLRFIDNDQVGVRRVWEGVTGFWQGYGGMRMITSIDCLCCVNQCMAAHWTTNQRLHTPLCILFLLMPYQCCLLALNPPHPRPSPPPLTFTYTLPFSLRLTLDLCGGI